MPKITISPPNAILFVLDPTNSGVVVPRYVDGELTAATETCISVGTQADVDGDTEVSLDISSDTLTDLHRVVSGTIITPGHKVAVVTSHFQRVLELDTSTDSVHVLVSVDDLRNPARVAVQIGSVVVP